MNEHNMHRLIGQCPMVFKRMIYQVIEPAFDRWQLRQFSGVSIMADEDFPNLILCRVLK